MKVYCTGNENYTAFDYYNEPSSDIVRLINKLGKDRVLNVLDLGSGIGRHSIYCAKKGHRVTAVDYSSRFLSILKHSAEYNNLNVKIKFGDFRKKLFKSQEFDLIIGYNSIYHGSKEEFQNCIMHCYDYLKEKGYLVFTCPSPKDYKYGQGIKIDYLTYQSNHEIYGESTRFFPTKDILLKTLKSFNEKSVSINKENFRNKNGLMISSYWYIEAQK